MMKHTTLNTITLAALLSFSSMAVTQSPPELIGEGTVVAFHKQMRNPVTPQNREMQEFATRTDLWIVRIDRWDSGTKPLGYYLVEYWLYDRAVTDEEINQPKLRFGFREPGKMDGKQPCEGRTHTEADPFKFRDMRIGDFQRTRTGSNDLIPPLKELPCLIVEKPPTVVKADETTSKVDSYENHNQVDYRPLVVEEVKGTIRDPQQVAIPKARGCVHGVRAQISCRQRE